MRGSGRRFFMPGATRERSGLWSHSLTGQTALNERSDLQSYSLTGKTAFNKRSDLQSHYLTGQTALNNKREVGPLHCDKSIFCDLEIFLVITSEKFKYSKEKISLQNVQLYGKIFQQQLEIFSCFFTQTTRSFTRDSQIGSMNL